MIYIVGENDAELFGRIGKLALSPLVHKEMGYHSVTDVGDIWSVSDNNRAFSSASIAKNGGMKIKLLYAPDSDDFKSVINEIIAYAKKEKAKKISVTDVIKNSANWKKCGFIEISTIGKNFINFEMELK